MISVTEAAGLSQIDSPYDAALRHHPCTSAHSLRPHHPFLEAFQSLLYILIISLFLLTFVIQPFRIPSESMEPTLLVGDFLLVDKQVGPEASPPLFSPAGEVHRGDVIVFHYPVDPSRYFVKRVVGLPGDRLRMHSGRTYIDGRPVQESYAVFRPAMPDVYRDEFPRTPVADPDINSLWRVRMRTLVAHGELTVPSGSYFVLGDNRNDSEDSRYWGFVPEANVVGKPMVIYFSLNAPPDSAGLLQSVRRSVRRFLDGAVSLAGFVRWDRVLRLVR